VKDPRVQKLAEVLVHYSTAVQPGDKVVIQGEAPAAPLIREVYAQVLQAGGHPLTHVALPGIQELFYQYANDEQLQFIQPPLKIIAETFDVSISIRGTSNTKALTNVDPSRIVLEQQAHRELMETFLRRAASGELRWTLTLFPTDAHAQDAEMSLSEYEDFVFGACLPDPADPVGWWQRLSAYQAKVIDYLQGKERVHIIGPDTDLTLSIAGRTFINSDGRHNMPSGEIFTGPVEDSAEGYVHFSFPAVIRGREVEDVRLWFEKGKVVRATAGKGEAFLLKMLDTDEGARYLGEFAIGTNTGITRFTRNILFDEKIGGTFHLAVGAGYPETGSRNQSSIHWDMICDLRQGGEIYVDDVLIYKDGKFVLEF